VIPPDVHAWVQSLLPGGFEPVPLAGDASTNRFYRLHAGGRSRVLLICADAERLPSHVHMSLFFGSLGLPVARLEAWNERLGALLMDDLGDRQLCDVEPSRRPPLYETAVGLIVRLQRGAGPHRATISTGFGTYPPPVLGRERLLWELEFFSAHGLDGFLAASAECREAASREFVRLVDLMRLEPLVYCHRDYHSRNIMVRDQEIHLVDLQDARWGHLLYDLASLLCDSYVDLGAELRRDLLDKFREAMQVAGGEFEELERQFDVVAIQRCLKAVGTFTSQARLLGRRSYLAHIPLALHHVEARLWRPELRGLRQALEGCGLFAPRDWASLSAGPPP